MINTSLYHEDRKSPHIKFPLNDKGSSKKKFSIGKGDIIAIALENKSVLNDSSIMKTSVYDKDEESLESSPKHLLQRNIELQK